MSQQPFHPAQDGPPSDVEKIKLHSRYLRGTIAQELQSPITGSIPPEDNRLLKFHGSYMQDDRDLRQEREQQKLEPAYQFMVRVRIAGGIVTPSQWLTMDQLAQQYANGTLRLTTRQTIQLHGILKWNLKESFQHIHESLLTTIAACGDVNRNVMCSPNPDQSELHQSVYDYAAKLSQHLNPRSRAYHEIFLDDEKVIDSSESLQEHEEEPIYGKLYLPRKFKIGIAVPPSNDVDIYSQDLGFIAIHADGQLLGFNVAVGGGMGMTYGDPKTYPQLARVIGFCTPEQLLDVAEKTIMIQRDFGNRSERKYARLKYTIDRRGVQWFIDALHERLGWKLEAVKPFQFDHNGDRYGWVEGIQGQWHLTLFIENGRIQDTESASIMTGLREIAKIHTGDFRLTPNQNIIIGNVDNDKKDFIEAFVHQYGLALGEQQSGIRKKAIACVALPTCGLAMAESERYFPTLLTKIEAIMESVGLKNEEIVIRMTGCPNGCARPFLGEIAFTGKNIGKYNMYLGGGFAGERLGRLYRENIGEQEILDILQVLLHHYARERWVDEHFGDFVIRAGYVNAVKTGQDFHQ